MLESGVDILLPYYCYGLDDSTHMLVSPQGLSSGMSALSLPRGLKLSCSDCVLKFDQQATLSKHNAWYQEWVQWYGALV